MNFLIDLTVLNGYNETFTSYFFANSRCAKNLHDMKHGAKIVLNPRP